MHTDRQPRTRRARALALGVLALGVIAASLQLPAPAASADALAMDTSFNEVVHGDYVMVGNGVMRASRAAVLGAGRPDELHNGVRERYNDYFEMVDANAVPAFAAAGANNSSSARFTVPEGARVVRAMLYWQGARGVVQGERGVHCTATAASGSTPGSYETRRPMLQVAGGPIRSVTGATVTEASVDRGMGYYYSGQADITSAFAGYVGKGAADVLSVGNLWTAHGANCHAGWGVSLVYDFGGYVPGNPLSVARHVVLDDGHVRLNQHEQQTISFTGFEATATGTRASFLLGEGDHAITGDTARYRSATASQWTPIRSVLGATDNIGVGHTPTGVRYQGSSSGRFHNANVDIVDAELSAIAPGTTAVELQLGTDGDTYMLQAAAFSVPVAFVAIEKTFTGSGATAVDAQPRVAGEPATFTITVTNPGSRAVTDTRVHDQLAPACARTIGTIPPGGSVTYTCTAPATAASYDNVASVTARAGTTALSDDDSSRVDLAAIALDKRVQPGAGYTGRAGDVLEYRFTIENTGDAPLTSVTLADPMPGLTGLAIDWATSTDAATRAGTLAPGERVTGTARYAITAADVARGHVENRGARATGTTSLGAVTDATASARHELPAPAAIEVDKQWIVDGGAPLPDGEQPSGLVASLELTGQQDAAWGTAYDGYVAGERVTIAERLDGVPAWMPGCSLESQTITELLGEAVEIPLDGEGHELVLADGENHATVTNRVACETTLTLVKRVEGGDAQPAQWTLSADGPTIVRGASGSPAATDQRIVAGAEYALSEAAGPAVYAQQGEWRCAPLDAAGEPVRAEGWSGVVDGRVSALAGMDLRCEVTNATAQLTLLKLVEDEHGQLVPADFDLVAEPEALDGLEAVRVAGDEAVRDANTFLVRPGHDYRIAESGDAAHLALAVERYRGAVGVDGTVDHDDPDLWERVEDPTVRVAAGEHEIYRFVNRGAPAFALPLTGGIGTDHLLLTGGATLALATLAGIWVLRRRRSSRP